jgi:PhoH-like ATPase
MEPIMVSFMDNFHKIIGKELTQDLERAELLEITPLAYIRGRSIDKSIIIVDEAQNSTIHELKTIITRIGEGSKIVLLGDTDQIDTPYLDSLSNGLTVIVEKFKKWRAIRPV